MELDDRRVDMDGATEVEITNVRVTALISVTICLLSLEELRVLIFTPFPLTETLTHS